jgi:hypothetical protein
MAITVKRSLRHRRCRREGGASFAGRDFQEGEIVEIAPRFIPMPPDAPAVRSSEIDSYYYGYPPMARVRHNNWKPWPPSSLGQVMFYNHHVEPNIRYSSVWKRAVS